jgi:hypothetical protein
MRTKICTKCGINRPFSDFNKAKNGKFGLRSDCNFCRKQYQEEHKAEIKKYKQEYHIKNKDTISTNHKLYYIDKIKKAHKKTPWNRILNNINSRCNNPNDISYKTYGLKGIRCLITKSQIKRLMIRDNYWNLKQPSIDRKDNSGNYTFKNCQFIEKSENSRKDHTKPILQFTKDGNFIQEWDSMKSAFLNLNIFVSSISAVCKKKRHTAGNFIWRYKDE